ncbi:hypothetical protein HNS03_19835 [Amorphus sp. 3PC139-8]
MKLFRVRIRCHSLDEFDVHTGSWSSPYYETEIGIGYAGFCFEALTVIALITRALEDLAATEGGTPKPEPEGIARLVVAVVDRYFKQHKRAETQSIELFLFGFSAIDLTPWLWKIVHKSGKGTTTAPLPLGSDDFHVIGNITTSTSYMKKVVELKSWIKKHKEKLRKGQGEDAHFELQLEKARHESADNKAVEEETLAQIESEFAQGVGGILQKMEAFEVGGRTSISFTRDDRQHILDGLPAAGRPGLGYVPIGEKMGRG